VQIVRRADMQNIRLFCIKHAFEGRIGLGMEIFCITLRFFGFDIGGSDKFRINAGGQDAAVYGGNTAAANQTGFHAFTPPLSVSSETLLP